MTIKISVTPTDNGGFDIEIDPPTPTLAKPREEDILPMSAMPGYCIPELRNVPQDRWPKQNIRFD